MVKNMMTMDKELLKALHCLLHINIHVVDKLSQQIESKYIFYDSPAFVYNYQKMMTSFPAGKPFFLFQGSYTEMFLLYDTPESILILGPFICSKIPVEDILKSLSTKERLILKSGIEEWLDTTPIFSPYDISYLVRLVHFCYTKENIDLMMTNVQENVAQFMSDKLYHLNPGLNEKMVLFSYIHDFEGKIIKALKQDSVDDICSLQSELSTSYIITVSRKFVDQQAYLITFIDKLCSTAMSEGVSLLSAFTLKEAMIEEVHTLKTAFDLATALKKNTMIFRKEIELVQKIPHMDIPLVRRVIQYFDKTDQDKLSVKELASQLHMSQSKLHKTFKSFTGEPISRYIMKLKVEKAKKFIQLGYSLQDIADLLGFKSYSHFSKVFKDITSLSPKQYSLSLQTSS
ncbi:TPA: helix-turn-helix domain-containing protein [Streptococcus suis]